MLDIETGSSLLRNGSTMNHFSHVLSVFRHLKEVQLSPRGLI